MTLTSEYQYIGRSNGVKDQNGRYSYYLLLYAKTSGDTSTGRHTVTAKMRLVSEMNTFYGYATSGSLTVAGVSAASWSWQSIPASAWNTTSLTEGGVTYSKWIDLREGAVSVDVGFGVTKDIALAASFTMNDSSYSYFPQTGVAAEVSASVTLPMIAGVSQPSLSAASVDMGKAVTIYTNRASSSFTHTLTYTFGSASGTIATGVGSSASWTPSLELARQIPNAVSGTATVTCATYSGSTLIGSKQVTITLTVPASVVPTVDFSYTDASGALGKLGTLVQNISAVSVDGGGTGVYGSKITGTSLTLAGKAYSGGVIKDSGSPELKLTATDSRGRTGSASKILSVAAYQIPSVSVSASRCTESGTADDTGSYAKITVTGFVTQVNGKNTASLKVTWGASAETISAGPGDVSWQKIVEADENATMTVTAVLTDALASASRTMVLSTGYATLDLLSGGKGIAFGKAATREGFDCAMPAYFSGGLYGISADGTVDSKSLFERVAALEAKLGM